MEKTKVWSDTGEDKSLDQDWGKDKSLEREREKRKDCGGKDVSLERDRGELREFESVFVGAREFVGRSGSGEDHQ